MKSPIVLKQLNVEVYGGCNYRCFMCPQTEGREAIFLKKLPYAIYEKIVIDALQYGPEAISFHGGGEPTLHPDLPKMVEFASNRGLSTLFFTNGSGLTGKLFEQLTNAGLNRAIVSVVGYEPEKYYQWMGKNNFHLVFNNLKDCREIMDQKRGKTEFHLRHLIIDLEKKDEEVAGYLKNWIEPLRCKAEIWMLHNWGSAFTESPYDRIKIASLKQRRSCGRPFAPALEVRAGGINGHMAAVVPCCYVLVRDSKAVLGHLDTQSIAEVFSNPALEELRDAHKSGDFDKISYCKDCDQLYDVPSALIWTNIEGRSYGQSKISSIVFTDFNKSK
jgi:MoaA/NifB/PqqE/SkfB family radical SAM enzyme